MGKTFYRVLRFAIGIASIMLVFSLLGITWAEATDFTVKAFKSAFAILDVFKGALK